MSPTSKPVSTVPIDRSRLLYRSQFVLGPYFVDILVSWQKLAINSRLHLTAHPDLEVCYVKSQDRTILLLGFILDPENLQATNLDILNFLMQSFVNSTEIYKQTARFGGRWILIIDNGVIVTLFHDAAGLRQVFYTDVTTTQYLWCASQAGILADILRLQPDPEAQDFINSPLIRHNREYWWPGHSSLYKEVKHLLPNHYLNLATGQSHRYWPNQNISSITLNTAVTACASILQGLLESAAKRFDLVLSLTAGLDSRLVLAACYTIKDNISYMTLKQRKSSYNDTDISVATSLLRRLQLPHDLVVSDAGLDALFSRFFYQNVPLAHELWSHDAYTIFKFYNYSKVTITGSVSEIARQFYKAPNQTKQTLNGEYLASATGMKNHPFAVSHFNEWCNSLGNIYNVNILDLFYWEQRAGNWLAMCQLEFDSAWKDIFSPYNCRSLLTQMLSVQDIYRCAPYYELYMKIILTLWPEVLIEPINPQKIATPTQRLKRHMKHCWSALKRIAYG
jgi:hypothetical protein